jgi:hypothetical protein
MRCLATAAAAGALFAAAAAAAPIANPVAVFDGLDKVTATITTIEIPIDGVGRFGELTITPRVCYTRPPTEPPQTTTFVEIDEHQLSGEVKRVFSGWMFASSPGIHGLEHPVYDVWLKTCKSASGATIEGILKKSP